MQADTRKSPTDGSAQLRTPQTLFEALHTPAFNQPAPIPSPIPSHLGLSAPQSPSPALHAPIPTTPLHENVAALAQLNYHIAQAAQIQPPAPAQVPSPEEGKKQKGKKPGAPKGKGSRSGKNARAPGHSDAEVEELDPKSKKEAEIMVPVKAKWDDLTSLKLAEFITAPEHWEKVSTSLTKICQEASQTVFNKQFTTAQCISKWQSLFRLYKDTKRYLNHTGGGDGDEDSDDESLIDELNAEIDEEDGENGRKVEKKNNSPNDSGRRYKPKTMRRFFNGPIYAQILSVAEGRADIERAIEFSSHRKPEEIDDDVRASSNKKRKKPDTGPAEVTEMLAEALRSVQESQVEASLRDAERFKYQKTRDTREEEQQVEIMRLERAKHEREAAVAELRQKQEVEELRFMKVERYKQMRDSQDPLERSMAKKLAEEIRAEEGL